MNWFFILSISDIDIIISIVLGYFWYKEKISDDGENSLVSNI